jgi:hypothetical protein
MYEISPGDIYGTTQQTKREREREREGIMSRMAQMFFVSCVSAAVGSVYYVHYTQDRDRKVGRVGA